jgi:hypothetical protein
MLFSAAMTLISLDSLTTVSLLMRFLDAKSMLLLLPALVALLTILLTYSAKSLLPVVPVVLLALAVNSASWTIITLCPLTSTSSPKL